MVRLDDTKLAWKDTRGGRKNYKLYHQVVSGAIEERRSRPLVARYSDSRPERMASDGEAVLATIMLDRIGRPVEEPAVAV